MSPPPPPPPSIRLLSLIIGDMGEVGAVSSHQRKIQECGTLTHYSAAPSWIMEQGLNLNDKQNDLETLQRITGTCPPHALHPSSSRLHAKLTIMQNEAGQEFFFSSIPPTQLTQPRVSQACWTIMSQTNSTLLMPCRARARSPLFFFFCYRNGPGDHFHLRSSRKKKKEKKKRKPCVLGISIDAKRGTLSKTMNNSRPARDNRCRARWSSVPTWQQRERKGKHAFTWGRRRIFGST